MVKKDFIPSRGDFVWINLNPTKSREQQGLRPALVLSPRQYNERVGMMLACPITSKVKGYPFEIAITLRDLDGVILVDQIRSIDWISRPITLIGRSSQTIIEDVQQKLNLLIND